MKSFMEFKATREQIEQAAKGVLENSGVRENDPKHHAKKEYNSWLKPIIEILAECRFFYKNGVPQYDHDKEDGLTRRKYDIVIKRNDKKTPTLPLWIAPARIWNNQEKINIEDFLDTIYLYGSDYNGDDEKDEKKHIKTQEKMLDLFSADDLLMLGASIEY